MINTSQFYTVWAVWLLIFVRMVGFFVQAPIWGSQHIPKPILVGIAAVFSIVMFPSVPVTRGMMELGPHLLNTDYVPFIGLIASQFAVGLVLGYVSYLIMAAVQFGAELLDVQMGLSVASSFDPSSHGSVNMIRRWAFYLAMILYLLLDGHYRALEAMKYSYQVIPLTGIPFTRQLDSDLLDRTGVIFTLGLQIASPIVASLFITQVALGLLARVAPQMNVFMLSFPLNIMIGLSLLASSLMLLRGRLGELFNDNIHWMYHTTRLMVPHAGLLFG